MELERSLWKMPLQTSCKDTGTKLFQAVPELGLLMVSTYNRLQANSQLPQMTRVSLVL